jgi:hypothetical protein
MSEENNILEQFGTNLEQPGTTFKIAFLAKVGANLTQAYSLYKIFCLHLDNNTYYYLNIYNHSNN